MKMPWEEMEMMETKQVKVLREKKWRGCRMKNEDTTGGLQGIGVWVLVPFSRMKRGFCGLGREGMPE
ncbi:hypothetical protein C5167_008667 [Papaver somniferum]|uniref:Uncharacterized protein n=1 Tax=Papaver somniferum TaxID=3469 RepID=A0A4Y7JYX2_PAPSO|nr:hypothetical protein C5167_008667 [Papaver somniferum]